MTAAVETRGPGRPRTKCWCGRKLEPDTNGSGRVVDKCSMHGIDTSPRDTTVEERPQPIRSMSTNQKKCTVKGCPGVLDNDGSCSCCTKRNAWIKANIPAKKCEICTGEISKGKFCQACAPLNTKANSLKAKSKA